MGQALIAVSGRNYRISCRDGDEARVTGLGGELAARADQLTKALGVMPESQLLIMTALMLADELADARAGLAPPPAAVPMVDITRLTRIVEKLEALAAS
ncbi:MAG: cell division protein ZapA [Sphingomonadales bacterium]|jgi:cell division protein ZapA